VGSIEANCQEERGLLRGMSFQKPDRRGGADAVGLLEVGPVGRQPAQRRAEIAGSPGEDFRFV
jgi:hypothetical protein